MKKTVKTLVSITCAWLMSTSLHAQLKLPVNSALAQDLKKVVADYPNQFEHLKGELIAENPQTSEYHCTLTVSGAEESHITRYSSRKNICSWEALMLTTDNFEKARQKYRSLFQQLNNLSADIGQAKHIRFRGNYEAPAEEKKFSSVIFEADPSAGNHGPLRLELALQFHEPMEWKVRILLYDREREDRERGAIREEQR